MVTRSPVGDWSLGCRRYNPDSVHPEQGLVGNDAGRFPAVRGQHLQPRGPARVEHRAQDGGPRDSLPQQGRGLQGNGPVATLRTVGGHALLHGLIRGPGAGQATWKCDLEAAVHALPIRPVSRGNVSDPTLGDDERNVLGSGPALGRRNHRAINAAIADVGTRCDARVDRHAHVRIGEPSWFTHAIAPSI